MFTKGADSVIIPRLGKKNNSQELKKFNLKLKSYSKQGYRTLCIAKREIPE